MVQPGALPLRLRPGADPQRPRLGAVPAQRAAQRAAAAAAAAAAADAEATGEAGGKRSVPGDKEKKPGFSGKCGGFFVDAWDEMNRSSLI